MKTLKILGCLLTYPTQDMVNALPECRDILTKEKWISEASLENITSLINWMSKQDILDLQEEYVSLFDRTPSLCLHLFEHVHGDSKDRGQALVDLSEVYKETGLIINTKEMPDYLPLFLEYLSMINSEEAQENLGEIVNVLGVLSGRLNNRKSLYFATFEALIDAATTKPDEKAVEQALTEAAGKSSSLEELDEAWKEQFAFDNSFQKSGQEKNAGCPIAEEMLARMNIPPKNSIDNKEA